MRLLRLTLGNFLAYPEGTVAFEEDGVTLIVGPNNAGKSTLLRALDAAARQVAGDWHRDRRQAAHIKLHFRLDEFDRQTILTEAGLGQAHMSTPLLRDLWIDFACESGGDVFHAVGYEVSGPRGQEVPMASMVAAQEPDRARYRIANVKAIAQAEGGGPVPSAETIIIRGSLLERAPGPIAPLVREWMRRVYHFGPLRLGTEPRVALESSRQLVPTGANIAHVLLSLKTNQFELFSEIASVMQELVPDVGRLEIRTDRLQAWVEFVTERASRNVKDLGTGVEQLLMTATVCVADKDVNMVMLEEPETNLHADAQRRLLRFMSDWSRRLQFVITTHSTVFLDQGSGVASRRWLVTRAHGASMVNELSARGDEVLDALGVRPADVLTSAAVVIVEGISDKAILEHWFGPALRAANAVLVSAGGGDRVWSVQDLVERTAEASALPQRVLFIRDRDELSLAAVKKARTSDAVFILGRRDLEGYLLEPSAVTEVLQARTGRADILPEDVASALERLARGLKSLVVAKRAFAELGAFRLVRRSDLTRLEGQGHLSQAHVRKIVERGRKSMPDFDSVWSEAAQAVDEAWSDHWRELVPGGRLLAALWNEFGLSYEKSRDGVLLARAVAPPTDLARAISGIASTR